MSKKRKQNRHNSEPKAEPTQITSTTKKYETKLLEVLKDLTKSQGEALGLTKRQTDRDNWLISHGEYKPDRTQSVIFVVPSPHQYIREETVEDSVVTSIVNSPPFDGFGRQLGFAYTMSDLSLCFEPVDKKHAESLRLPLERFVDVSSLLGIPSEPDGVAISAVAGNLFNYGNGKPLLKLGQKACLQLSVRPTRGSHALVHFEFKDGKANESYGRLKTKAAGDKYARVLKENFRLDGTLDVFVFAKLTSSEAAEIKEQELAGNYADSTRLNHPILMKTTPIAQEEQGKPDEEKIPKKDNSTTPSSSEEAKPEQEVEVITEPQAIETPEPVEIPKTVTEVQHEEAPEPISPGPEPPAKEFIRQPTHDGPLSYRPLPGLVELNDRKYLAYDYVGDDNNGPGLTLLYDTGSAQQELENACFAPLEDYFRSAPAELFDLEILTDEVSYLSGRLGLVPLDENQNLRFGPSADIEVGRTLVEFSGDSRSPTNRPQPLSKTVTIDHGLTYEDDWQFAFIVQSDGSENAHAALVQFETDLRRADLQNMRTYHTLRNPVAGATRIVRTDPFHRPDLMFDCWHDGDNERPSKVYLVLDLARSAANGFLTPETYSKPQ